MNPDVTRRVAKQLTPAAPQLPLTQAVVVTTYAETLTLRLANESLVTGVRYLGAMPSEGDTVWAMRNGPNLIVLGKLGKDSTWQTPVLYSGWTSVSGSPAQYMIDSDGFVNMRGLITGGNVPSVVFYLPTLYYPAQTEWFTGTTYDATNGLNHAVVYVLSTGSVTVAYQAGSSASQVSLSQIRYSVV